MRGLGILILVVLFFWIGWPVIARWLKRRAVEKAEDYMRAQMGMPPRDRKKERKKEAGAGYGQNSYTGNRRNPYESEPHRREPIIPKEYAEDVEFTETHSYSETITIEKDSKGETKIYKESQVSDAEYIEIKEPRVK